MNKNTYGLLLKHYKNFPYLQAEDMLKFLFQSVFGCEHLVSDESIALLNIESEFSSISKSLEPFTDALDGNYSRVYLSWINEGLSPETLAKLFCLSAKAVKGDSDLLLQKIEIARELISSGDIPLCVREFENKLTKWQGRGFPALHHSDSFRNTYKPAYRVIYNKYTDFLCLFSKIDKLLLSGNVIVAIEGGSASGKSTLAEILSSVYDCNIFHIDDFFLRPEQRTAERFKEIGGNLDRERFFDEVVSSLNKNEAVNYRPFDCSSQSLCDVVSVAPKSLTVVEGVYSMHPAFGKYYNLSVFLDISPELQCKRIEKRNSPSLAKRFFEEWIPLENVYFEKTELINNADLIIKAHR